MGTTISFLQQLLPYSTDYTTNEIPDLTGKVTIVTGANTGIGKETAKELLQHNARVYIAARNQEKAEQAIWELQKETGKLAQFLKLDLADLPSVKKAAEEFLQKETELHILFNNGGVMSCPVEEVTAQGYDLQFGTNVLGHFYFTKLLLPTLLATAKSSPKGTVRIVTSSSSMHWMGDIDFNTLKDGPKRQKMSTSALYSQSKIGNVIFAKEIARRYGDEGIVSTSLHPGNIASGLQRYMPAFEKLIVSFMLLHPIEKGVLTQLYAGTSPEGANLNGKYLTSWAREVPCKPIANDPQLGKELWNWLEEQIENL